MPPSPISKLPPHLLKNPTQLAYALADLRNRDAVSALQALTELLHAIGEADDVTLEQRINAVNAVDGTGRLYQREAARRIIEGEDDLNQPRALHGWAAAGAYLYQLGTAYAQLFDSARAAHPLQRLPAQPVHLLGRAVRARGAAIAWDCLRYTCEFGRWADLYALAPALDELDGAEDQVRLYREEQDTTLWRELLQPLMLAVAQPQSLQPVQLLVAQQVTRHLAAHIDTSQASDDQRPFFFDAASGAPPQRVLTGVRPPFTARRFGIGAVPARLGQLIQRLEHGVLRLADLGLGNLPQSTVRTVLLHLRTQWCDTPPERKHHRRRDPARMSVIHGFEEVAAHVGDRLHTYPFVSDQESWLVENTSERGVGAVVGPTEGVWARVGTLIAYCRRGSSAWSPAMVRHIREEEDGSRYFGIEILASRGVAIALRRTRRGRLLDGPEAPGIWLPGRVTSNDHARLLVAPGLLPAEDVMEMQAGEQRWLVRRIDRLESGEDYEVVLCKVVAIPGAANLRAASPVQSTADAGVSG